MTATDPSWKLAKRPVLIDDVLRDIIPLLKSRCIAAAIALSFSWFIFGVGVGLAQDNSPIETFDLLPDDGRIVGVSYTINAEYGENNGVVVPAPFRFRVPNEDGVQVILEPPVQDSGELIKISFATEDRQLIENMRLVKMTLPLGDKEERLAALTRLLANDGFALAAADHPDNEFIGSRNTTFGGYDGVEAIGKFMDDNLGLIYVRLVGIPNPDSAESIIVICNIVFNRVPMENFDDLSRTRTGTTLRLFEYIEE